MTPPPTTPPMDWSSLPAGILETISSRVSSDADYVRFGSVCTSWRSAAPKRVFLFPWLIVRKYALGDDGGDRRNDEDGGDSLRLSNYPNTTDLLTPHLPDGLVRGKYIFGSSLGWIGLLDEEDISLYNPCTGHHVRLPPLPDLPPEFTRYNTIRRSGRDFMVECHVGGDSPRLMNPFYYFRKFLAGALVLSSDPVAAPDDCVVMSTFFGEQMLIYCCPGDTSWTPLSLPAEVFTPADTKFGDIIYYQGKFYAVSGNRLFVCHTRPDARVTEILPADPLFTNGEARREDGTGYLWIYHIESFLVVSSGDLLLAKIIEAGSWNCEVFRVDLDGDQLRLIKLENLGGRALFLGWRSMSLSAGNSPRCKENCVYYIDQYEKSLGDSSYSTGHIRGDGIIVINLEDGWSTSAIASPSDEVVGTHWLTPNLY